MATRKKSSSRKRATSTRKAPAKRRAPVKRRAQAPKRESSTTRVEIPQVPIRSKWDVHGLAYAFALLAALDVLIVSLCARWMQGAVALYQSVFVVYEPTLVGTIAGMAEGAIYGLIFGALLGWLYNKFSH